jgi:PEP-CTERM motif-containing protein
MGKSPPLGLGRSHRQHVICTIPWCNTDSYSGSVISALLLAGLLDPNCLPRYHTRPREFAYHSHYYHAPPPPACREPWPDPSLREVKVTELPYSAVEQPAPEPPNLGHSLSVIWPGYAPNPPPAVAHPPPTHEPHGGPGVRAPGANAPVSVPEPSTLALFAFGTVALFALRQRSRRQILSGARQCVWGVDIRSHGAATRFTSPRSRRSDVMQVRLSGAWCDAVQRRRCGCAVFCLHLGSGIVMEKSDEKLSRP